MNKLVIRIEREPLSGVLRARVESELATFYNSAAAIQKTDVAELLRPILRDGARRLIRREIKLRNNRQLKALVNAL